MKTEYLNASKLKKSEELERREAIFNDSVKLFHKQMGELNKTLKVLRENWIDSEIVVEFSDTAWDKLYAAFIAADIVSLIDSFVYEGDK